jgi:hypothetical protein
MQAKSFLNNNFNAMLKFISITIFFFHINSCGNSQQKIKKDFNSLQIETKNNYEKNKQLFNELKNCLMFKYIKHIEFKKDGRVKIQYKVKDTDTARWGLVDNDTHEWGKIEDEINSKEITSLLDYEGITKGFLPKIKTELNIINANAILILDGYDLKKGFDFKAIEIKYLKEVNGLYFFYRIFDRPVDSIENSHFPFVSRGNIGGVLDNDIIYYYK